jgi:CheY-like chemotaxis protein
MRNSASPNRRGVLVVEDDFLIRMTAVDFFVEAGFPVFEAGGADEAIRLLEQRADIGAVFTDVNMPGAMDGLQLAHYVRRRWPSARLILTSGRMRLRELDLPPQSVFLPKPYLGAQLAKALRERVGEEALS